MSCDIYFISDIIFLMIKLKQYIIRIFPFVSRYESSKSMLWLFYHLLLNQTKQNSFLIFIKIPPLFPSLESNVLLKFLHIMTSTIKKVLNPRSRIQQSTFHSLFLVLDVSFHFSLLLCTIYIISILSLMEVKSLFCLFIYLQKKKLNLNMMIFTTTPPIYII